MVEHKLFLNKIQKIDEYKSRFKKKFPVLDCIKNAFTISMSVILLFGIIPSALGYSFTSIEPRSNSMKDSLGNIGFGYYKNYKAPIFASVGYGDYLSGNDSYIYYNISDVKNDIKLGDVVIFNRMGVDIIHQVIEVLNYGVITKGTNNIYKDGYLDYEDIEGKLVFWVRIW